MAEKLVATAEQAEAKGDTVQARDLYLRLGFVVLPRPRERSPKLPRELESVRMRLERWN